MKKNVHKLLRSALSVMLAAGLLVSTMSGALAVAADSAAATTQQTATEKVTTIAKELYSLIKEYSPKALEYVKNNSNESVANASELVYNYLREQTAAKVQQLKDAVNEYGKDAPIWAAAYVALNFDTILATYASLLVEYDEEAYSFLENNVEALCELALCVVKDHGENVYDFVASYKSAVVKMLKSVIANREAIYAKAYETVYNAMVNGMNAVKNGEISTETITNVAGTYLSDGAEAVEVTFEPTDDTWTEFVGTVTVAAGATVYFPSANGTYDVTVEGEGAFTVASGADEVEAVEGVAVLEGVAGSRWMPAQIYVTNNSEAEATYTVTLQIPLGSSENPEVLETIDEYGVWLQVSLEADDADGYTYKWVSDYTGYIVVDAYSYDENWDLADYVDAYVYNLNTYVMNTLWNYTSDWEEINCSPIVVWVNEGDEVLINVSTKVDYETWTQPAADIYGMISLSPATEESPIMIGDQYIAWVPAGETTVYGGYSFDGNIITVKGDLTDLVVANGGVEYTDEDGDGVIEFVASAPDSAFGGWFTPTTISFTNNGEWPSNYEISVSYPVGDYNNPEVLELGVAGSQDFLQGDYDYYLTWTAEEDGVFTFSILEDESVGGWFYYIENSTTYVYGDWHYFDDEPAVASDSMLVSAGDVIIVAINTYDPEMWGNGDGTVAYVATFEGGSFECEEHQWELYGWSEGDCINMSYEDYECTVCGAIETRWGDYGDHTWDVENAVVEGNVVTVYCESCDAYYTYEVEEEIPEVPAAEGYTWEDILDYAEKNGYTLTESQKEVGKEVFDSYADENGVITEEKMDEILVDNGYTKEEVENMTPEQREEAAKEIVATEVATAVAQNAVENYMGELYAFVVKSVKTAWNYANEYGDEAWALVELYAETFNEVLEGTQTWYDATHGSVPCYNDEYVAIGGTTASGSTLDRNDTAPLYAEIVAEELGVNLTVLAENGMTAGELLALLGTEEYVSAIENATMITVQLDVTDVLALVLDVIAGDTELDWTVFTSEENVQLISDLKTDVTNYLTKHGINDLFENNTGISAASVETVVEAVVYAVADGIINTRAALNAIQEINPDATLVVVGLYTGMDEKTVEVAGKTVPVGTLVEYGMELTDLALALYATINENVVFVELPAVETGKFENLGALKDITSLEELAIWWADSNYTEALYANAAGHEYIAEQIIHALTCDGHNYSFMGFCRVCGVHYCDGGEDCILNTWGFTDVDTSSWYHDYVHTMVELELMIGTSATTFAPGKSITRAEVVRILWNAAGQPEPTITIADTQYVDVEDGTWYTDAALWAYEVGIAQGNENNEFMGLKEITREEIVTMIFRYAQMNGLDGTEEQISNAVLADYTDANGVSLWATDAMKWAVSNGVVNGRLVLNETYLEAGSVAGRHEVAAMFCRFCWASGWEPAIEG